MTEKKISIVFSLVIGMLSIVEASFAQWNTNSAINTPVCTGIIHDQKNVNMGSDTKGGAIIVWTDERVDTVRPDIYAQRINSAGYSKWATNGTPICTDTSKQASVAMTEDGSGGAIIVWQDYRNGYVQDIYAQKIDSSGNVLWTSNGVTVCSKAAIQKNPKVMSDGAGGAFVVWEDSINGNSDIYAQRISSTGTMMWTAGGVSVCNAAFAQITAKMQTDGAGGAIIVWQDKRNGVDYDIYAQRINASGFVQWATNGVFVCSIVKTQGFEKIKTDGQGGVIIAWQDKRNSTLKNYDIYAQRVDASGAMQWTVNGVPVCTYDSTQKSIDIITYNVNGAIVSWQDKRSGDWDIYAQKVNMNGTMAWGTDGIPIATGIYAQASPKVVSDGIGGAIISWQDSCCGNWDIKSQRVDGNGTLLWGAGGVAVGTAAGSQTSVDAVTDSLGGCIFAWQDQRNGIDYDVYAHYLKTNGVAARINELSASNIDVRFYPNPFSNFSFLNVANTKELEMQNISVKIYDVMGREQEVGIVSNPEGFMIGRGNMTSGIYFYRVFSKAQAIASGSVIVTDF
ncbi:MAG: T9SS type A sorting domain-containing protein [Bacteroidetes bacterium]|nr:T9SS type A sorting domain-containing protein [Bacteroidota bacterium]